MPNLGRLVSEKTALSTLPQLLPLLFCPSQRYQVWQNFATLVNF